MYITTFYFQNEITGCALKIHWNTSVYGKCTTTLNSKGIEFDPLLRDSAVAPEDLINPPGNHFEALTGRNGFFSIRINDQWRITFSWNEGAENVKIEDYH